MTPHRKSPITQPLANTSARRPLGTRVFRGGLLVIGLTSAALVLGATGCGSNEADDDGSGGTSSGGGDASGGKNGSGGGNASGGDEGTGGNSSGGSSTGGNSSTGGQSGLGGGGGDGGAGTLDCPETPPTGGALCAADGMCSYQDCDTFGQVVATCADGEWSVDTDACSTFTCSTGESCQADEICLSTGTVIVRTCEPNTCGDSPVSCDCLDSCDGDCPVTGSPEGGIFVDCTE